MSVNLPQPVPPNEPDAEPSRVKYQSDLYDFLQRMKSNLEQISQSTTSLETGLTEEQTNEIYLLHETWSVS